MSFIVHPERPAGSGVPHRGRRPALVAKAGGLAAAIGIGMLLAAVLLGPHTDAERAQFALEALFGGPRARMVLLLAAYGRLLLVVGLLVSGAAGVWAVARAASK